jgi:hypothetical protein
MGAKHTPGPWYVGAQNDALYITNKPPSPSNDNPVHDRQDVIWIGKVYGGVGAEERPNARLIAAAPEMYDALCMAKAFFSLYGAVWTSSETHEAICAAIAKVEGRS